MKKQVRIILQAAFLCLLISGTSPETEKQTIINEVAQPSSSVKDLFYPLLVKKFYQSNSGKLLWFSDIENAKELRKQLVSVIDSSFDYGIIKTHYHYAELKKWTESAPEDSAQTSITEKIFTDAAIAAFKDIYQGYTLKPGVGFDPISPKFAEKDDEYLLSLLLSAGYTNQLLTTAGLLEPKEKEYLQLKKELKLQQGKKDKLKIEQLIISMNYYRGSSFSFK